MLPGPEHRYLYVHHAACIGQQCETARAVYDTDKIDTPFVQLQWDIACAVRKIPAYNEALALRISRDVLDVKCLAGVELHTAKPEQRSSRRMCVDGAQNLRRREGVTALLREDGD